MLERVNTMKEELRKAFRQVGGRRRYTEIDLEGFKELSQLEKVLALNESPGMFMRKYETLSKALLIGLDDGFMKASSPDAVKPSNSSKISDMTGEIAVKRECINSGNVEAVYEYGNNEKIDRIIDLERTLKIYFLIIDSFRDLISNMYHERLNGLSNCEIADKLGVETDTVITYFSTTKNLIEDKYNEVMDVINASNTAKKRDKG